MTKKKLISALVKKQSIDDGSRREKARFVGGGKNKPIRNMLEGMEPIEKLIFLAYISDEMFSLRDINTILRSDRRWFHHKTMKRKFAKLWEKRKHLFPDEKIRKIEGEHR